MRSFTTMFITVAAVVAASLPLACDEPSPMDVEAPDSSSTDAATGDSESTDDGIDRDARGDVLARAWLHAFRRYLAGFPGGASELELRLAEAIEAEELGDDDLRAFLEQAEGALNDATIDAGAFDVALDEPITDAMVERLMPATPLALAVEPQPPSSACSIPLFSTLGKYRLELEGIQSLKSPTDGEHINGEAPYYTWSLLTPTARWSGRTNYVFPVWSTIKMPLSTPNAAPSTSGSFSSDALLLFRIFERDDWDGGNFYASQALTAAKAASAAIAVQIDWNYVATYGKLQPGLVELYDTLSRSGSGYDDVYEVEQIGVREKRLWEITNGCWYYQKSQFPFGLGSGDYYDKMAMRLYDSNGKWRTWVSFRRL